jgi:hypothetical protein
MSNAEQSTADARHYFDSRGVARVYAMTITDEAWTLVREHPGFSQRFVGAFSGDGRVSTVAGRSAGTAPTGSSTSA